MPSSIYTHSTRLRLRRNEAKERNVDADLDDTPSNPGSIVKRNVETEHVSCPIHHQCLEFRTCWASGPLTVVVVGHEYRMKMRERVSYGVSINERDETSGRRTRLTLNPGLGPIPFA